MIKLKGTEKSEITVLCFNAVLLTSTCFYLTIEAASFDSYVSVSCLFRSRRPGVDGVQDIDDSDPRYKPWVHSVFLSISWDILSTRRTVSCLFNRLDANITSIWNNGGKHDKVTLCNSPDPEMRFHLVIGDHRSTHDCTHKLNCSEDLASVHSLNGMEVNWNTIEFFLEKNLLYATVDNGFKPSKVCILPLNMVNNRDKPAPGKSLKEGNIEGNGIEEERRRRYLFIFGSIICVPLFLWFLLSKHCTECYVFWCHPPPQYREIAQGGPAQRVYTRSVVISAGQEMSMTTFPNTSSQERRETRTGTRSRGVEPVVRATSPSTHRNHSSEPRNDLDLGQWPHSYDSLPYQHEGNTLAPSTESIQHDLEIDLPSYDSVSLPSYNQATAE